MSLRLFLAAASSVVVSCNAFAVTPKPQYNIDDALRTQYQQSASANCTSVGDCEVAFPALSANTLLQNVSCGFELPTNGILYQAFVTNQIYANRNFLIPLATSFTTQSGTNYVINTPAYLFFASGDQPRIDVYTGVQPLGELICTLSGYTLPPAT